MYQDTTLGGAWAACNSCQFSGDLITLFATAKSCRPDAAVEQLKLCAAIDPTLDTKILFRDWTRQQSLRTQVSSLLDKSLRGGRVITDPGAIQLLSQAGIDHETSVPWACDNLGKIVGHAACEEVEHALRLSNASTPKRHRERELRVLPKNVANCLMVPFWESLGNPRAVAAMTTHEGQSKWSFMPVRWPGTKAVGGGLAGHPDVLTGRASDDKILLTNDLDHYIRMHARNSVTSPKPLSLVCFNHGEARTKNWQLLAGRSLVLWAPQITPDLLWTAIELNAQLSTHWPRTSTFKNYLRCRDARSIYERCISSAKQWPAAVSALTEQKDVVDLADFIGRMHLTSNERERLIDACDKRQRGKLKRALDRHVEYRTVPIKDGYVEQRISGWYYVRPNKEDVLITNAPFKFQQLVQDGSRRVYCGDLSIDGATVNFEIDEEDFHANPIQALTNVAVNSELGVPTLDPAWKKYLSHIALQMHPPRVVRAAHKVGVCPATTDFRLPLISISPANGVVRRVGQSSGLSIDNLRSADFEFDQLTALLTRDGNRPLFSVFLACASQALRRASGLKASGVALRSKDAVYAATLLARHGVIIDSSQITKKVTHQHIDRHDWPCFVASKHTRQPVVSRRFMQKLIDREVVMAASKQQLRWLRLCSRATIVRQVGHIDATSAEVEQLGSLLVQMISTMYRHGLSTKLVDARGAQFGTAEIATLALRQGGIDNEVFLEAARGIEEQHTAARSLAIVVASLIKGNRLTRSRDMQAIADGSVIFNKADKRILVPCTKLVHALKGADVPQLDHESLAVQLVTSTPAVGLEWHSNTSCWVLDWDMYFSAAVSSGMTSASLRIHTA